MKMSKNKRRAQNAAAQNAAPVAPADALHLSEEQQTFCAVAVRESNLELLGKLVDFLNHLREEVL